MGVGLDASSHGAVRSCLAEAALFAVDFDLYDQTMMGINRHDHAARQLHGAIRLPSAA